MQRNGASPGGPAVSAAKRRRLAALDDALLGAGRSQQQATQQQTFTQSRAGGAQTPFGAATAADGTLGGARHLRHIPSAPALAAASSTASAPGDFPYNPLGDAVLDGSLSAALAQAKAAAEAAAAAAVSITTASFPGAANGKCGSARTATATAKVAAAAAAAAAAAGGDSVAAEVLAQLVATNPRASSSDLRTLLSQRLQDRSVLLDNPTAALTAKKLFARRTSSYSAKLRSNVQVKQHKGGKIEQDGPADKGKGIPSYQTMLQVHELWLQYTQGLARHAAAGPGTSNNSGGAASSGAASSAAVAAAQVLGRVADLHGAMVSVAQHRNPQLVGATGVVLRRSSTALHLVTPGDRLRVVPLKGCVARYTINGTVLQLTR